MSRYQRIAWNDCDVELYDLLEERCAAKLAGCAVNLDWNDLTRSAQDRIEQQCMDEIESGREESFAEARIDAAEYA